MPIPIDYPSPAPPPRQAPAPEFKYFLYIAAILLLAGAVTLGTLVLHGRQMGVRQDRLIAAKTDIASLGIALDAFKSDTSGFPTSAESLDALVTRPAAIAPDRWHGPYLERLWPDPWGHPYRFTSPGIHNPQAFDLSSDGPDGKPDTDDDITNFPPTTVPAK